jgi:flagellar biosynthetic protein FlhB
MSGEKTEKATPKKLQDLRKKGSVARSVELSSGITLLAMVLVLPGMLTRFLDVTRTNMALILGGADVTDLGQAKALATTMITGMARALAPGIATVGAVGLLAGSLVSLSKPNPAVLKPKWERVNPAKAIKRMFSPHTAVELIKNIVKLALVFGVTVGAWKTGYSRLLASGGGYEQLMSVVGSITKDLLLKVALLAALVGVADAAWQRKQFNKQAKMSKQDVADEHKQSEGDPHAKGHRRALMLASARNRMMVNLPTADVVLANPTHLVVALKYTPGQAAPVVVAKGAGGVAARIKEVAAEHGVPVIADKPLARAIYRSAEIGDTVPAELFRVVAEVLAAVYAAKRRGVRPNWNAGTSLAHGLRPVADDAAVPSPRKSKRKTTRVRTA